jgi:hypothetical protein
VLDEVRAFLGGVEARDDITVMAACVLDGARGEVTTALGAHVSPPTQETL